MNSSTHKPSHGGYPSDAPDRIQQVRQLAEIQAREAASGDAYMVGLFNGLELALATLESREPRYQRTGGLQAVPARAAQDERVVADMETVRGSALKSAVEPASMCGGCGATGAQTCAHQCGPGSSGAATERATATQKMDFDCMPETVPQERPCAPQPESEHSKTDGTSGAAAAPALSPGENEAWNQVRVEARLLARGNMSIAALLAAVEAYGDARADGVPAHDGGQER